MSISCVLIDMKFISKLFSILLMENLLVSDPRSAYLYKHIYSLLHKNTCKTKKPKFKKEYDGIPFQHFEHFQISDSQI